MNQDAIIKELEAEQANQERAAATVQGRVAQLKAAIAALSGKPTETTWTSTPVVDLVADIAKTLNEKTPGCVFDHKALVTFGGEEFPTEFSRVKKGVYAAVATLKRKGVLKLAQGGFTIA